MRSLSLLLIILSFSFGTLFADYQIKSDDIRVESGKFSGNLSPTDTTVQKALETIDSLDISSNKNVWGSITGAITNQTDLIDYLTNNYQSVGDYLTSESDTLQTVTSRGNITSNDIHVTAGAKIYTDVNSYHYTDPETGFTRFFFNNIETMRYEN
jgi:hypothetical protein